MAVKYLRNSAAGAGTGADWTNAYTTLVLAFAGMAAGDTVYVADDHAETQGSAMTLTSPGTAAAPCRVLCCNTHVTTPPTALAASASISTTGQFAMTFGGGYAYIYGITFNCSSGSIAGGAYFAANVTSVNFGWILDTCKVKLLGTAGALSVTIGAASSSSKMQLMKWINTTFKTTGSVGSTFNLNGAKFVWVNTPSAIDPTGTIPTNLFTIGVGSMSFLELSGIDLSALGSGKNLFLNSATPCSATMLVRNCQLGASVTVLNGSPAIPGPGLEILLDNSDSGNTNVRMEHYKYQGSIVQETTKVRTSGASDGTTPLAHKLVTLASGPTLFSPLEGPWMTAWNETLGPLTATVEVLHDSLTALTDAEIWLEVEYLGTASLPLSVYANDRVADAFATPASQTASTVAWTTTGITNVNKQKLEVAFTPAIKCPIRWRVCMAKSNYTVYVDPVASGLATPSREYLVPGTAYVNETGTGTGAGAAFARIRTGF